MRDGECLSAIAHRYGLKSWPELWNDDNNAALREKRKSPHVLHPGDEVAVPGLAISEVRYATDATYRIEVARPELALDVVVADHHGRPFKSQPYELFLTDPADAKEGTEPLRRGTTGGDGSVREKLSAGTTRVFIALPEIGITLPLAVSNVFALPESAQGAVDGGGLPTREVVRALKTRLNALGVACGTSDTTWTDELELALRQLRRGSGNTSPDLICDADLSALASFGV